jgi:hypothetical protein
MPVQLHGVGGDLRPTEIEELFRQLCQSAQRRNLKGENCRVEWVPRNRTCSLGYFRSLTVLLTHRTFSTLDLAQGSCVHEQSHGSLQESEQAVRPEYLHVWGSLLHHRQATLLSLPEQEIHLTWCTFVASSSCRETTQQRLCKLS